MAKITSLEIHTSTDPKSNKPPVTTIEMTGEGLERYSEHLDPRDFKLIYALGAIIDSSLPDSGRQALMKALHRKDASIVSGKDGKELQLKFSQGSLPEAMERKILKFIVNPPIAQLNEALAREEKASKDRKGIS